MGLGLLGACLVLLVGLGGLWTWALLPGPGGGQVVQVHWSAAAPTSSAGERLAEHGLIASPRLFELYLRLVRPSVEPAAGAHLLNDRLSPRELVQRLGRLPSRPTVKVAVPEGFNHVQLGERLEKLEVCSRSAFIDAVHSRALLAELSIRGSSAEGLLYPATYELGVNSTASSVVRTMVRTFRARLAKLSERYPQQRLELSRARGWSEHEIATLASIVEKEAAHADERPTIASVYYNRLDDPDFRPKRMLQADPTAAYGCLIRGPEIPSCSGFDGRVTPAMLRDPENPYNTYRHAGLPPGPIANAGAGALESVLSPARTDYLFFVATGQGRHTFSRTLEEHNRAIDKRR